MQGPTDFTSVPPFDAKLGISGDQRENAELAFPITRETAVAFPQCTSFDPEVWTARWNGGNAGQNWSNAALLVSDRETPDVAFFQADGIAPPDSDDKPLVVYDTGWATKTSGVGWTNRVPNIESATGTPTVAALAHDKVVSVWVDTTTFQVKWSEMDRIAETWSDSAVLATAGSHPEIAALTGSPSLPRAEWSYLYYMSHDTYRDSRTNSLVGRMESVGSTSLVNMTLQVDRRTDHEHTRLFYVKKGAGASTELQDLEQVNMAASNTLRDFIARTVERYPADNFILSLRNHGKGWRGVCKDNRPARGDWLDMPELRTALNGANRQFELITLSACQMGMVEVAYQLRESAKLMVASQENHPTPTNGQGIREDVYLNRLITDPHAVAANTVNFAGSIVTDYQNNNNNRRDYTLSAVDVNQVVALGEFIDSWAKAMIDWIDDPAATAAQRSARRATLRSHINNTQRIRGNGAYRDLFHFATRVQGDATVLATVRNAAQSVLNRQNQVVVAEWHQPDPCVGTCISKVNATGLNIWLPTSSGLYTGGGGSSTSTAYNNLLFIGDFVPASQAPPHRTWSRFLELVHQSTDILVQLESSSPDVFVRVEDGTGRFVGGVDDSEDCGRFCASNVAESVCEDEGTTLKLWLPADFTSFTAFVDGTLLPALDSATFTLTIQTIVDGVVTQEQVESGTVDPGQVLSFSYPPDPSPGVGGIAELPEVAGTPLETPGSSGPNAGVLAGVAGTVAVGEAAAGVMSF